MTSLLLSYRITSAFGNARRESGAKVCTLRDKVNLHKTQSKRHLGPTIKTMYTDLGVYGLRDVTGIIVVSFWPAAI